MKFSELYESKKDGLGKFTNIFKDKNEKDKWIVSSDGHPTFSTKAKTKEEAIEKFKEHLRKINEGYRSSRLNEASSFKYGALNFTIKKQSEDVYKLLYTSGPMKCEIFLNVSPDEEGEINITLSDYVEWFDSPQLKSLTKLLNEITDGDIVDVYKLADLVGIEIE